MMFEDVIPSPTRTVTIPTQEYERLKTIEVRYKELVYLKTLKEKR